MKQLYIIILLLFPCGVFAQDDYNAVIRQQNGEISRLYEQIEEVNSFITKRKEELYILKLSWYNTCVKYLQEGEFKQDELDILIRGTKSEIDGEDLLSELKRAKDCSSSGISYEYNHVNPPSKESSVSNKSSNDKKKRIVPKKDSSKKSEKKTPEVKDSEKKDKKDSNPPVEDPKSPTTPVATPEVKDKPIESDPKKDKPGDEKVIVETPVKNDNPPVEPEAPKKSEPVAPVKNTPKKMDKGEMEEGMSKKSKNNDGSNK